MRRREFLAAAGGAAVWPVAGRTQSHRMRRIGVLIGISAGDAELQRRIARLRQRLRDLGWTDADVALEVWSAEGKLDRLPTLAAELVQAKVDAIVTGGTEPVQAARRATGTIPIVMASIGDAVGAGIVPSLARPGGNVTGLTLVSTEQGTKRLELMKEILPGLVRVAALWNGNNVSQRLELEGMNRASALLGLQLQSIPLRNAGDLDPGFQAAIQGGAKALVTMEDALVVFLRPRIVALAMREKLPVVGEFRVMSADGGLMSYGPSLIEMWGQTAGYIDKIFKGVKPGDLPIQAPTKFELVINLRTAKALGLTIPEVLLLRADEVIE